MVEKSPFRVQKPEFLNNALQQRFHDRERAIQLYVKARQEVARIETDIAWSACPWQLGQMVTYTEFDTPNKAIVYRIAFNPENPFYTIYLRLYTPKGILIPKPIRVDHISTIMGAMNSPPVDNLPDLIAAGYVRLEDFIDPKDKQFSSLVFRSYHRGQALMKISPQVEELLRTSLAQDCLTKKSFAKPKKQK